MEALRLIDEWPAGRASAGVLARTGDDVYGDGSIFEWASVTKLATALVVLVAAEEGVVDLDEPAGPPGSTLRHLLAHASGLPPEQGPPLASPGRRRVYSNYGFDVLAAHVAAAAEMPFDDYFREVLGETPTLEGPAGSGARGDIHAALAVARFLMFPGLLAEETLAEMTTVQFPGLTGVLPGYGRQEPNDWGLGVEIRNGKSPHWTGRRNSPQTFGHFGQTGTFLWIDPDAGVALACLTDAGFGDWAKEAWPRLADDVLSEVGGAA